MRFSQRRKGETARQDARSPGQRAAVAQIGLTLGHAQQLWQHFSDPQLWPAERLFFELYAQALLGRPGTEAFLENAIEVEHDSAVSQWPSFVPQIVTEIEPGGNERARAGSGYAACKCLAISIPIHLTA